MILSLDQAVDRLEALPPLPAAVHEVIRSIGDPNVDARALADRIGRDQALAARMLRVANSPFYGASRTIESIREAVTILGFNTVRSMAIAAGMVGTFPRQGAALFDLRRHWRMSLGVAEYGRALARELREREDVAFTGGLLHDMGLLVMNGTSPGALDQALALVKDNGGSLFDAEREVMGYDHAELGGIAARRWNFPEPIEHMIRYWHIPDSDEPHRPMTDLIHAARAVYDWHEAGLAHDSLLDGISPAVAARLTLDLKRLKSCIPDIAHVEAEADILLAE